MDFRAASAARGFNWGFLLTRKDSNLQHQNQNLMCYRYTTGQLRGATCIVAYTLPLVESVSSVPALAMEEVCVATLETIWWPMSGLIRF